jgi:hypothetical protein
MAMETETAQETEMAMETEKAMATEKVKEKVKETEKEKEKEKETEKAMAKAMAKETEKVKEMVKEKEKAMATEKLQARPRPHYHNCKWRQHWLLQCISHSVDHWPDTILNSAIPRSQIHSACICTYSVRICQSHSFVTWSFQWYRQCPCADLIVLAHI